MALAVPCCTSPIPSLPSKRRRDEATVTGFSARYPSTELNGAAHLLFLREGPLYCSQCVLWDITFHQPSYRPHTAAQFYPFPPRARPSLLESLLTTRIRPIANCTPKASLGKCSWVDQDYVTISLRPQGSVTRIVSVSHGL